MKSRETWKVWDEVPQGTKPNTYNSNHHTNHNGSIVMWRKHIAKIYSLIFSVDNNYSL